MDAEEQSGTCKVVLVGESGVGKTSIITQFIENTFTGEDTITTNATFSAKKMHFDMYNKDISFEIWDTAGQEKYRSLSRLFYKEASVGILVYDITKKNSFEELKKYWSVEIQTNAPENIILAVVGNKGDLFEKEQVSDELGKKFADEYNAIFRITSAKSSAGINELFEDIGIKFLGEIEQMEEDLEEKDFGKYYKRTSTESEKTRLSTEKKKIKKRNCCA